MAGSSSSIDMSDMPRFPSNLNVLAIDTDLEVLEFIEKSCNKNSHQVTSEDRTLPTQEKAFKHGACDYWFKPLFEYEFMFQNNNFLSPMMRHHIYLRRRGINLDSLKEDEKGETGYDSDEEAEAGDDSPHKKE